MEAIILAGGLGTRLKSVLAETPKCMAPVNGKPFLYYVLKYLKNQDFKRVVLSVGYLKEQIIDYLKNENEIEVAFAEEEIPLGTGGALKFALDFCKSKNPFVLNGDTLFNVNLKKMLKQHADNQSDITIAVRRVDDVSRYGEIEFDEQKRILNFKEKSDFPKEGFINGGTYIVDKELFRDFEFEKFSLEKDFFVPKVKKLNFSAFISNDSFLDIGIPSDYEKASAFVKKLEL